VGQKVRAISYNVRSFRGGVDDIAEVLAAEAPDLVLIQECGPKPRLARVAELLDMDHASSHRMFNRVRNGVLFHAPWRAVDVEVRDLSREGRTIRRGYVSVVLRAPGYRLTVVSAHLGLGDRERGRHARELTDYLAGVEGPLVLGMDLNEVPSGPSARWIAERFYDAFAEAGEGTGGTLPARDPTSRIDYVFASDGVAIHGAWVPDGALVAGASDHRPVVADLLVEPRAIAP
jgi:endonuclease/exonuclease/phosphatase family metal-dependent hydrolase